MQCLKNVTKREDGAKAQDREQEILRKCLRDENREDCVVGVLIAAGVDNRVRAPKPGTVMVFGGKKI